MPFAGKPVLGVVGGIGAGKSFVAGILRGLGCEVIDSDAVAHAVYAEPNVMARLVGWFGPSVVNPAGKVDRHALAARVFRNAEDRTRLESFVHPLIHAHREARMAELASEPDVRAFVWDSPLLIEAKLHLQCDEVIFVDTPREERLRRVQASRGWNEAELARREASQLSLEEKRRMATAIVPGDATFQQLVARLEVIVAASLERASALRQE